MTPINTDDVKSERNDDLNSGFAKHIEKEKVIEAFHSIAWPALAAAGWTKASDVMLTDDPSSFSRVNSHFLSLILFYRIFTEDF